MSYLNPRIVPKIYTLSHTNFTWDNDAGVYVTTIARMNCRIVFDIDNANLIDPNTENPATQIRLILPPKIDLGLYDYIDFVITSLNVPIEVSVPGYGIVYDFAIYNPNTYNDTRYVISELGEILMSTISYDIGTDGTVVIAESLPTPSSGIFYPYQTVSLNQKVVSHFSTEGTSSIAGAVLWGDLELTSMNSLVFNSEHTNTQAPIAENASIFVNRNANVGGTYYYDAELTWKEDQTDWYFTVGDVGANQQYLVGSKRLIPDSLSIKYDINGNPQGFLIAGFRWVHTEPESLAVDPTVRIDNIGLVNHDTFEILLDNSGSTIARAVVVNSTLYNGTGNGYPFWVGSSTYAVSESSKLIQSIHLPAPPNGEKHLYRFTLHRTSGGSSYYWVVTRYHNSDLDYSQPTKILASYDNLSVNKALSVNDVYFHGLVKLHAGVEYSVEASNSTATYSLTENDHNYVALAGQTVFLAEDPRTCIGRQYRIFLGANTGGADVLVKTYKQSATLGQMTSTVVDLIDLTGDDSTTLIMAVPFNGGLVRWMVLSAFGSHSKVAVLTQQDP